MPAHCILKNNLSPEFAPRARRIHKLERHGVTWGVYSPNSRNAKSISDKEHETRSQSLYNNVSQSSEEQLTHLRRLTQAINAPVVPRISQEVLQQELLRILEQHYRAPVETRTDIVSKENGFAVLKCENNVRDCANSSQSDNSVHSGSRILIKKPIGYEPVHVEPSTVKQPIKPQQKVQIKVLNNGTNFDALKSLLLGLFTRQLKEEDLCELSAHEVGIFQAVLERKNYNTAQCSKPLTLVTLNAMVNTSARRSEEKFKFIIKRIIKHLKKKEKIKTEHEFYRVYFADLSVKLGVPLDYFYDPHNKLLKNTHFKSLSTDYVMLLLKSDLFLIELLFYLEKSIIKDHIESLETKVSNLCKKWENIYESLHKEKQSADFIKQLILNTEKGSKLPWSVGEVNEAIDLMKNIVYSWNSQKYVR